MITEYYRPSDLAGALKLLSSPNVRPLGGGTLLSHPGGDSFAVVDLQALGLNTLQASGDHLEIGATLTLQGLLESSHTPSALKAALKLETPLNLRNMGTVAGTLVTCDGRSPFACAMLALDAKLTLMNGGSSVVSLGDLLPVRPDILRGKLITAITIPLTTSLAFQNVARTPADKPIVCAALARWPSGRVRLVIGGWGSSPSVAMDGHDQPGQSGIEAAARNAAHDAADQWASAEYRSDVAAVLARRCLGNLQ
jgi:CO/xanthine dehydrogenase FAD-binding subunit